MKNLHLKRQSFFWGIGGGSNSLGLGLDFWGLGKMPGSLMARANWLLLSLSCFDRINSRLQLWHSFITYLEGSLVPFAGNCSTNSQLNCEMPLESLVPCPHSSQNASFEPTAGCVGLGSADTFLVLSAAGEVARSSLAS